jgi:tyrosyl-tRNA synthetase
MNMQPGDTVPTRIASEAIETLFSRGVESFIDPQGVFRKKLEGKIEGSYTKDIVIKFGIDPTRPDIHLGHAFVLRKLRSLQDLGCKIIFLVGDFTATIGDPTGKDKVRPEIDNKAIYANLKTYLEQIDKILDVRRDEDGELLESDTFSWISNGDWLYDASDMAPPPNIASINLEVTSPSGEARRMPFAPQSTVGKALYYEQTRLQRKVPRNTGQLHATTLRGLLWTLRHVTHARLIGRDMFQKRITEGKELFMHEMLYPVLQGIDSYMIERIYGSCDLEVGGSDQTFNMLMGRDVMKANGVEEQAVLALRLLEGLDGKEKMSKSLDNYIAITDTPGEMYGKLMSLPDTSLRNYFALGTYTPAPDIEEIIQSVASGKLNPRDVKRRLAREVVAIYHGEQAAEAAENDFVAVFSNKGMPADTLEVVATPGTLLIDLLIETGVVSSKTEFRRLITEGAIRLVDGERITDPQMRVDSPLDLKIGKHRFLRARVESS